MPVDSIRLVALSDETAVLSGRTTVSVFERRRAWEEVATFTLGAQGLDITQDTIAVQARGEKRGITAGDVYILTRSDTGWNYTAKISPVDYPYLNVGESVALNGDRLLIGVEEGPGQRGYLFEKTAGEWVQLTSNPVSENLDIDVPDPDRKQLTVTRVGEDVALSQDYAVMNTPGTDAVYSFPLPK